MITHTATNQGYELKVKGQLYGLAVKELDGSFSITGGEAMHDASRLNHPTMAALKAYLEPLVPANLANPPKKADRLTYQHAKATMGGHSRTHAGIREARQMWPEKRDDLQWIYAFLIRRGHELKARFDWGQRSRDWLAANPNFGAYDYDEFTRRVESTYGPQPSWTW